MPDAIFDNPQLVAVYDAFDGPRDDLDLYEAIAAELGAGTVIDLGCGTGVFARRLARTGIRVVGIDPAQASIDLAEAAAAKESLSVDFRPGTSADIPAIDADLVTMTGNVAQVFLGLDELRGVFADCARGLRRGGHLAFESRIPEVKPWTDWSDRQPKTLEVDGIGEVTETFVLGQVDLPFVSFTHLYRFAATGDTIGSRSRLRFRGKAEIASALEKAGFAVREIRDAPDRIGREWVFLAERL
ncbi:class I SAM-dependent methyltransferase [Brevibacterium casei]|uniref:class I SAM-dependent methyltransferase n=1 Tax=Brevibacterium casei TaxID=33889 RepID=UPI003EEDA8C5